MQKAVRPPGAKRKFVKALPVAIAAEIIGRPEVAVARHVALDEPVVCADPRLLEPGAFDERAANVVLDIHAMRARQFLKRREIIEETVIKRRARGRKGKPICPYIGKFRSSRALEYPGQLRVGLNRIGIIRKDQIPNLGMPADIVEVEPKDRYISVDRAGPHLRSGSSC